MVDLLDKDNLHVLLEKQCNKGNSFIANINLLASKLDIITRLNGLFTEEEIEYLVKLSQVNLDIISEDIAKGSINGYRKLDINLLENFADYKADLSDEEKIALWKDTSKQVYYSGITVYFRDKTYLSKDFSQLGVATPISNHHQLFTQLQEWPEFRAKFGYTMFDIVPDTPIPDHELLRVWDGEGDGSYIDSITLHVAPAGQNQNYDAVFAGAKEYSPVYTWADSTSVLLTIGQKINELLSLSYNQNDLLVLREYLNELGRIYAVLDELVSVDADKRSIYSCLDELLALYDNLNDLVRLAKNIDLLKTLENKANKIVSKEPAYYDVVNVKFDVPNDTTGYYVGEKLTSGEFTFTVTEVMVGTRMIIGGKVTPIQVNRDKTGFLKFTHEENPTSLIVQIECTPSNKTVTATKDLQDVYDELNSLLKNWSDITTDLFFNDVDQNNTLEELKKLIEELETGGGASGDTVVNSDNYVLKKSDTLQTINSNISLGLNNSLQGTNGTSNFTLLQFLNNQVITGSVSVPLVLQTADNSDNDNHINVITSKGKESLAYLSDVTTSVVNDLFIGFCSPFAGDVIPAECKVADGTIYSADDYPIACAVLGSKYGGDGVTTFGVPNLTGQSPSDLTWVILLGKDNGSSSRVYCGREGIYCGREGLYAGCSI